MARPKGTTRAKEPLLENDYDRLMIAVGRSPSIKSPTRVKLKMAFTLLYFTGCRISEIIQLQRADIEYMIRHNNYSLTNSTKTNKPRLISFDTNHEQTEYLKKILTSHNGYLFAKNRSDEPMTVSALKLLMNKFIHRVLGELYSTHSFRSGYITIAHKQGLSLEHIRDDIGHENIATTALYTKVTSEEIAYAKTQRRWVNRTV